MPTAEQFKIVISDCHLSAGRFYEGRLNVHEDFHFDKELSDLFDYFSTGLYGDQVEVELFINGDFFDFLNVPLQGEFEEAITEELSLMKLEAILKGHPQVMAALRKFAAKPNKKITYLLGNHDADLFFPRVRERIRQEWDPEGKYSVNLIANRDRVQWEGGVVVHHGNQFEAVHFLDFDKPILEGVLEKPVLNIPWGSFYVLKIINRLKWEREFLDKVRPAPVFVVIGLLLDTRFTLKFVALSIYYFLKTRFVSKTQRRFRWRSTLEVFKQETNFLLDLEKQARSYLDQEKEIKTVILGHTHQPINKVYPDGKQYINTGTWTKMINLDWRSLGQQFCLTFAFVRIHEGLSECELRYWVGEQSPHRAFQG